MSVTINLTQLKRKKTKTGEIPIYIRFTENGKSWYKSTGISVLPKYWLKKDQAIRKSHPRYKKLNHELQRITNEAENKLLDLRANDKENAKLVKDAITKKRGNKLLNMMTHYEDELKNERYWEWKHFKVVNKQIEDFLNSSDYDYSSDITIKDVDTKFLEDFQHYLMHGIGNKMKKTGEKNNSPNTVRRKLRYFRGFINELIKSEKLQKDPYLNLNKPKEQPVSKTRLTIDQIQAIENVQLKKGSNLWHARNYFLYSFYNAGIRFGDLCQLKWNNIVDDRLEYQMSKTGGRKSIKQLPVMQEILNHYRNDNTEIDDLIFPILDNFPNDPIELLKQISSKNFIVNRDLKKVTKKAGIDSNVSFHVARHSFSQYALKNNMPLYEISKALGHSSIKITERYINSFDEDLLDKSMDKLFG
ncbi:MAG: site-specific integrase [Balneolaceae bacterium]|nr:site-specific integrase [Balneolaceae bacterium]